MKLIAQSDQQPLFKISQNAIIYSNYKK